jgi:ribA/ribD-fused uncharacterized protein
MSKSNSAQANETTKVLIKDFVEMIWPILQGKKEPYLRVFEKIGEEIGEWQEAKEQGGHEELLSESADLIVTSLSSPICFANNKDELCKQTILYFNNLASSYDTEATAENNFATFVQAYGMLAKAQRKWRKNPLEYNEMAIAAGVRLVYQAVKVFLSLNPSGEKLNEVVKSKISKWLSYDPPAAQGVQGKELNLYINKSKLEGFENIKEITHFDVQWNFLSNFYMCDVIYKGKSYPSVEHAYQASKVLDTKNHELVRTAPTAGESKILGRLYHDNENFDNEKLDIMETLVRDKFTRSQYLKALLGLTTDAYIIEGNTWNDTFWGVCNGKGDNHLGKILMKIRKELI